jgi:hypothetical protein
MKPTIGAGPLSKDLAKATAHAANEEFTPAQPAPHAAANTPRQPSAGWDPYEVWRTRIKPAQSKPDGDVTA